MKRVGHLFEQAFSRENLYQAYLDASRHKHGKRACFQFTRRLAFRLDELHRTLHDGSYQPKPYYMFEVYEPKLRLIYAPSFGDLVVQHAIYRVIYSIFDPSFIDQSFACRKGKGTHRAADYAQRALRSSPDGSVTLKLDIRKFFYRIDRNILRQQIERKIKDRRFVDVMMQFAEYGEPVGIPIGNLLSQTYALIYLSPLDHFIKRELKIQRYCRYVDDFVLFGLTREQADQCRWRIEAFLHQRLNLELSRYSMAPVQRGLNFVGYRTWRGKRFVRKRALYVARRAIRLGDAGSLASSLGHARKTHSLQHILNLTRDHNHDLYRALPHRLRRAHHVPAERAEQPRRDYAALHRALYAR